MNRRTRKDLKTDKFAQEVGHTVEFLSQHRSQSIRYGLIVLAVAVIGVGIYFYNRHQATLRAEALASAMRINDAVVSPTPQPPNLTFVTQDEKDKARTKAFMDLAATYHGSQEGAIAQFYLAGALLDQGKLDEAQKIYQDVADSAPADYASVAKVSLAQILAGQGKTADAEKLLRALMSKPTIFVSKEQAELTLAQIQSKTDPAAAKKLLDPLRQSTSQTIQQAAVALDGEMSQNPGN
ncbi:MAG: tetratricopeptide repeat protein [Bryobacteraceae bacterium]